MSKLKAEAARRNGAKSKGPVTPEGKLKSSLNSIRHGLFSKVVVLPHEDKAAFEQLHQSYLNRFRPIDDLEAGLVKKMADATWRRERVVEMETNLLHMHMLLTEDERNAQLAETTPEEDLAWTFDKLANSNTSLALLLRYETSLNRAFDKALKQLQDIQKVGRASTPAPGLQTRPVVLPSEPKPANDPRSSALARGLSESIGGPISLPQPSPTPQNPTPEVSDPPQHTC